MRSIPLLIDTPPVRSESPKEIAQGDSLSPIAPWCVVNIGNLDKVRLLDFIDSIEKALGIVAKRNFMAKPKGNFLATQAVAELLQSLTGYQPQTEVNDGIVRFIQWFREYYNK